MAGGERSEAELRRHRGKKIDFNGLNEVSYGPLTADRNLFHYCSSAAISNTRKTSRAR